MVHDRDEVGQGEGFRLVVRHIDEGAAELLVKALELAPHGDAQGHVEVAQGLVHQEYGGLADDGSPERHPLALPAGKLPGPAFEELGDPERLGGLAYPAFYLHRLELHHAEREAHVPGDAHVRVERVALKDHRDVTAVGGELGDGLSVEGDRAVGDRLEPGHQPQARRLAAARGAEQGHEGTVRNAERKVVHRHHRSVALGDPRQANLGHQPFTEPASRPETIMRWNTNASTSGGMMAITPALVIRV